MSFKSKVLAAAVLAATVLPAAASYVSFHSRFSSAQFQASGDDYRSLVEVALASAPGAGYCDTAVASFHSLSNQTACPGGSNNNLAKAFYVDFSLSAAEGADFSLRVAPDFGYGGAVFLDGQLLGFKADNLWWLLNWANGGEIFEFDHLALGSGPHHLAIYGLEDQAEGLQDAQFRVGSGNWVAFGLDDGLAGTVPEPASLALALVGLAGAAGLRRSRPA